MSRDSSKAFAIHGEGAASDFVKEDEPQDFEARVRKLKRESEAAERKRYAEQQEQEDDE